MIKINIVIDLKAKFENSTYIRLEEEEGEEEEEKRKKKKNANNVTNQVLEETESTCQSKSEIPFLV